MKAPAFAIAAAVPREPGRRSCYSNMSILNSIFNSSIHVCPLNKEKSRGKHTGQTP